MGQNDGNITTPKYSNILKDRTRKLQFQNDRADANRDIENATLDKPSKTKKLCMTFLTINKQTLSESNTNVHTMKTPNNNKTKSNILRTYFTDLSKQIGTYVFDFIIRGFKLNMLEGLNPDAVKIKTE
jgi:hypothetical protein